MYLKNNNIGFWSVYIWKNKLKETKIKLLISQLSTWGYFKTMKFCYEKYISGGGWGKVVETYSLLIRKKKV